MSVSNAFTTVGAVGSAIQLEPGESTFYAVTGTFTGTVHLERRIKGGWTIEVSTVADTAIAGQLVNATGARQTYRWRAAVATGTATATLTPAKDSVPADAVGARNGVTVSADELTGVIHKTVLRLNTTPITITDEAGVGQYGAVKVYDMPPGNLLILGAVLDAVLTLDDTEWTDAAEGDVGVGTTAVDDGDALATTEQTIIPTTAIAALTAQVGAIDAQAAGVLALSLAGGTDADIYVNIRIDDAAAHITGTGSITGVLTLVWVNLGDSQ